MDLVLWCVVLLAFGLGLFALELFVPSGGILSIAAAACLLAAVIVGFTISIQIGVMTFAFTTIVIPVLIAIAIRWWPHTPIGRLILLGRPESPDEVLPDTEEYRGLRRLVGRHGMSRTKMLPSGIVEIDGKNYDAMSEGVAIESGTVVEVIDVRTNRVIVRPHSGAPAPHDVAADDLLSQPLDSLGIDELDEPL